MPYFTERPQCCLRSLWIDGVTSQTGGQKSSERSPGGRTHRRHRVGQAVQEPQQSHGRLWFLRCRDSRQDSGIAERLLVALGQGNQLLLGASGCLSVCIYHPVLVCQGCQNKAPQTTRLQPQKRLVSQFRRLEV